MDEDVSVKASIHTRVEGMLQPHAGVHSNWGEDNSGAIRVFKADSA